MTKEEAIYCMKSYIDDNSYEHCTSCPYYGANQIGENIFVCKSGEAHKMAIVSLEAWDDVKQEINDLFNKPAYYMPNYDAYKMFLEIIDKHLQKV